jgi:hypothetical protein
MLCIIIIIILVYILYNRNIETFVYDTDDIKFFPVNDGDTSYLPTSYHLELQKNKELGDGVLSNMRDHLGLDSHYYLFKAPLLKDTDNRIGVQKTYTSQLNRPIYLPGSPTKELREKHYNDLENLDKNMINDTFKYPYRSPKDIGNKLVYDYSNSFDMETELEERRLRLKGFRRPVLTEDNDFTSMTFCNNIDEMGTDYPCYKYGLKFDYNNATKLANKDEYSSTICCKQPL